MPTARLDRVTTLPGTPVSLRPLANDDAQGGALIAVAAPAHGTATATADGTVTYTPEAGFEGTDRLGYTLRDAAGATAEGIIEVLVGTAPSAGDDEALVSAGRSVDIAVLANDVDPDGDPLRIVGLSQPDHGIVELDPGQKVVRYRPQAGFTGIDRFSYSVADPSGLIAGAMVSVAVSDANRAPEVQGAEVTTTPGTAVTVPILATASDPDDDPLSLISLGLPAHGRLAVNPDRSVTYQPAAGYQGPDRFTYTLSDNRGGSVEGEAVLTIARQNRGPIAVADRATTAAATPVTLPLLVNDADPDGDPLTLVALGMPQHGIVAVGADQSVTYTPEAGFEGTDRFGYTVRDSEGVTARAEAVVTVAAPATPPAFANGYFYRRRIVIPPQPTAGEPVGDFVLYVDERGDWLKDVARGGRVQSPAGHDIRFTLEDGSKLDHELDLYDPVAGALTAWVRLPTWDPAEPTRLFLYHGKAGLTAAEAAPQATWQGCLAVIDPSTGADLSGHGRDMAAAAVSPARLAGRAARFDGGTSLLSAGRPDWLDGKVALTVAVWAKSEVAGSDRGLMAVGPYTGQDAAAGFVLRHDAQGSDGQARSWLVKMRFADRADARVESPAATAGTMGQMVALRWSAGGPLRLFLDGVEQPAGADRPAGPTAVATGEWRIGAGPSGTTAGRWQGIIGRILVWERALAPALLQALHANQADPQGFYGIGAEDAAGDPNGSPVAVPVAVTTRAGSFVDLDPLAQAFDPNTGDTVRIIAFGQPDQGSASVVGSRLRYAPLAGFTGLDRFPFTLSDGRKASTARATVTVIREGGGGTDEDYPDARRIVPVTSYDGLKAALAAAQPGDHLVIADGRTITGAALTVGRQGTETAPIVIRPQTKLGATLKVPITFAAGSAHCWLWGLKLHELSDGIGLGGSRNRVRRCDIAFYKETAIRWNKGERCAVEYSVIRNPAAWSSAQIAEARRGGTPIHMGMRYQDDHPRYPRIFKVGFYDCAIGKPIRGNYSSGQSDACELGSGGNLAGTETFPSLEYVLVENWDSNKDASGGIIDVKTSRGTFKHITLVNTPGGRFDFRCGSGHYAEDVWLEKGPGMVIHDRDHVLNGVRVDADEARINLQAGNVPDGQYSPASGHTRARNVRLARAHGTVVVGGTYDDYPALGNRIEGQLAGEVILQKHQSTGRFAVSSLVAVTPRRLTRADVGPNAD